MTTPPGPARKRASKADGKRDSSRTALSKTAAIAAPTYPPLKKARLTMPEPDFARLRFLKERLKALDRPTRKNELLRAGLSALSVMADEALLLAVERLPPAKPPKERKAQDPQEPGTKTSGKGKSAPRTRRTRTTAAT